MSDDYSQKLTALFIEFLQTFGSATEAEREAFLDFIKPQERSDLVALAQLLVEKSQSGKE